MKITKEIEKEILAVMDDYCGSYLKGDLQTYASYLPDNFRNIGTTHAEIWNSKKEILDFTEMVLDQMVGMAEARNKKTQIIPYAPYIMVHELADVYVKAEEGWIFYAHIRISSLLERTTDGWKVLHQHSSYPDSKTEEGETLAFSELKAENKKLRDAIQARTIDLERKNRELEIEAALERVRTASLAMHHTSELQQVVNAVHNQLSTLEIPITGGAFIFINNEENKKELTLWGAGGSAETVTKVKIPFLDRPIYTEALKFIQNGPGLFTEEYAHEEKIEFFEHMFKYPPYNQAPAERKKELMSRPGGYTRSIFISKNTGVVIINHHGRKFTDDENNILKRIAIVFEQAYTRFLDLQRAEAQAREAQIEAAVERVRAQSMAMHHSDDLDKVNKEILNQLNWLQVPGLTGVSFYLTDEHGGVKAWDFSSPGNLGNPNSYTLQYDFNKYEMMGEPLRAFRQTALNYYVADYPLEKLEQAVYELEEINPVVANIFKEALAKGILTHQWSACARISDGLLGIDLVSPPSEDTKTIVLKIAGAFNQAYQRFLDLQLAEAQAREAQIEVALEKVRSRTMAMHSPRELEEVVAVIAEKLQNLGIILDANGVILCTYFKDSRDVMHWISAPDFSGSGRYLLPYFDHPIFSAAWESKENGEEYFSRSFTVEEKNSFFEYAFEHSDYRHFPEEFKQWVFQNDKHSLSFAWAKNSAILIPSHTGVVPTEADIEILKRFAKVFEQAYVRFMDLQTKEEQAAKIAQEKQRLEKTLRDLQLTQKQLIHAEKMASLGELTAGIAHEIQNPLNFVNNFSEVTNELIEEMKEEIEKGDLEEAKALANDIQKNLEKIHHHGGRADAIVKGMLQHSRQSTAEKAAMDMNKLADEYLRLAYHGLRAKDKSFNANLHADFDPALEPLMVIPQEMGRVLLNLITNAFYAVHEKKGSSGPDYQPTVTVHTKKMADHTLIAVKDNGNGIPQKVLDKIFQPFFTTKPTGQGTGLGLSLSYDMVKAHNGRLEVETEEGAYTIFKIILPN